MTYLRPKQSEKLSELIERMLNKGIVIDSKIRIRLYELHLIKMRGTIILSSFEGAAKHGLDFPSEVNFETQAWHDLLTRLNCPQCNKKIYEEELEKDGCPWCGYKMGAS